MANIQIKFCVLGLSILASQTTKGRPYVTDINVLYMFELINPQQSGDRIFIDV